MNRNRIEIIKTSDKGIEILKRAKANNRRVADIQEAKDLIKSFTTKKTRTSTTNETIEIISYKTNAKRVIEGKGITYYDKPVGQMKGSNQDRRLYHILSSIYN